MKDQHLHNKLGNVIGEAKKRMFERLKQGQDLELAIAQFSIELASALRRIEQEATANVNAETVAV